MRTDTESDQMPPVAQDHKGLLHVSTQALRVDQLCQVLPNCLPSIVSRPTPGFSIIFIH